MNVPPKKKKGIGNTQCPSKKKKGIGHTQEMKMSIRNFLLFRIFILFFF